MIPTDSPSPTRRTCLMGVFTPETSLPPSLWIGRLNSNGAIGRKTMIVTLSSSGLIANRSETLAHDLLSLIAGYQVIHFDTPQGKTLIDDLLLSHTLLEMDNPLHDIAPFTRRLLMGHTGADLQLSEIPALCGSFPSRSKTKHIPYEACLLEMVYRQLIKPKLGAERDLGDSRKPVDRTCADIALSTHGLPLPCPVAPDIPTPPNGWRNDPWHILEARDVALRFAEGASLEDLSRLTGRSPRAIIARLQIDNILQRG